MVDTFEATIKQGGKYDGAKGRPYTLIFISNDFFGLSSDVA